MNWRDRIRVGRHLCRGTPCIKGARVSAWVVALCISVFAGCADSPAPAVPEPVPVSAAANFQAEPLELSAEDLAAALKLRWWKHELRFDEPVIGVTVTLYELKRNNDGEWHRIRLTKGAGIKHMEGFEAATLSVLIPEQGKKPDLTIRLSTTNGFGTQWHMTPDIAPDFRNMWFSIESTRIFRNHLVLASQFKDQTATDRDEDLRRVIGWEITTE